MTTIDFMRKQKENALRNLMHSEYKTGVTDEEKRALREKFDHYATVVELLEALEKVVRKDE